MTLTDYAGGSTTASGCCSGDGGYSDISEGTAVTVYDATGKVLAVGHLYDSEQMPGRCQFQIKVSEVPNGEQYCRVEVSHRGKVTFSAKQVATGQVGVTLDR